MLQRKYDIKDYDLDTDVGVYLSRQAFYYGSERLVAVFSKLEGYLDASGKQETTGDKILVVAASLSSPYYWMEFSKEWMALLREKEYPLDTIPYFHTAQFHYGNYPFRGDFGWDEERKNDLYNGLIQIIKRRTLYSIATGIDLADFKRFTSENPATLEHWHSAGGFAFVLSVWKFRQWAFDHKYDETIALIYDRGDKFADEMKAEYDSLCENKEKAQWWFFKAGGMTDGDKTQAIPIQAADVIAWEVARHYKEAHKAVSENNFTTRAELDELNEIGAEYKIYGYEDFIGFWDDRKQIRAEEIKESLIADGEFTEENFPLDLTRYMASLTKEELDKINDKEN